MLPIYIACVWSNTIAAGQLHSYSNKTHPPAHLQDLNPTLAGIYSVYVIVYACQSRD